MTIRFKTLIAASVLATLSATGAYAGGEQYGTWNDDSASNSIGSQIYNVQTNNQTSWSNLNATVDNVGGDVVANGTAGGNSVDITTMNDTVVQNKQTVYSGATIGSNVSLNASNVYGSVGITNQVTCNGASVSTDPTLTAVHSVQSCNASDPYSSINTNLTNIHGDAVISGSAISNSLEADSNAPNMPIFNRQNNNSASVSNVNANVANVGGSVGLTSTAIGNQAQVIHYSTN